MSNGTINNHGYKSEFTKEEFSEAIHTVNEIRHLLALTSSNAVKIISSQMGGEVDFEIEFKGISDEEGWELEDKVSIPIAIMQRRLQ